MLLYLLFHQLQLLLQNYFLLNVNNMYNLSLKLCLENLNVSTTKTLKTITTSIINI